MIRLKTGTSRPRPEDYFEKRTWLSATKTLISATRCGARTAQPFFAMSCFVVKQTKLSSSLVWRQILLTFYWGQRFRSRLSSQQRKTRTSAVRTRCQPWPKLPVSKIDRGNFSVWYFRAKCTFPREKFPLSKKTWGVASSQNWWTGWRNRWASLAEEINFWWLLAILFFPGNIFHV